jgi:hypothetical protein
MVIYNTQFNLFCSRKVIMTYFDVFYERKMKKKKMINKIRECNIEESNHMYSNNATWPSFHSMQEKSDSYKLKSD